MSLIAHCNAYSVDKVKEWKMRVKRRTRKVKEIPFGLRDQAQAKVKKYI